MKAIETMARLAVTTPKARPIVIKHETGCGVVGHIGFRVPCGEKLPIGTPVVITFYA